MQKHRSRKSLLTLVLTAGLAFACAVPVLANGADLLSPDNPIYLWIELDEIQNGRTSPTNMYPLTSAELYSTILKEDPTSPPPVSNQFVFTLEPFYSGFNTPYTTYGTKYEKTVPTDMIYLHEDIPALIRLGDVFSVGDWMQARLSIEKIPIIKNMVGTDSYAPWKTNTIFPGMEFPKEGYVSMAFPHVNVAAGRFKSGIGYGYFGNTFLNGKAPWYDQVRASYYNEHFKFSYMLGSSQTFLTPTELAVQQQKWDNENNQDLATYDLPVKLFAYHRAEWHPLDWMTVGLGEMSLIGGRIPDFQHINPFGIWHNTYTPDSSNVMAMLDVSLVPVKGLHLFGEYTMDDFRIPGIEGEASKPPAAAYQVGARYVLPFWTETKHLVGVEYAHVDPFTYNRWQPYLTMYQRQIRQADVFLDIPLGYLYGGDLNQYGVYYQAVAKDGLKVEASYNHLDKGQIDLGLDGNAPYYSSYPSYEGVSSPTGVVETRDTIAASASVPLPWSLTLDVHGSYSWIKNFGHSEGVNESLSMFLMGLQWSF